MNVKIVNLTQHNATQDQLEAGVFEPQNKVRVRELLTFNSIPSNDELEKRATELANIAVEEGAQAAMIGGAPYFMSALEDALLRKGVEPVYAFSLREAKEVQQPDGSVKKVMTFRHIGFVRPFQSEFEK